MSEKFPDFMKIWHAYPRTVLKGLSLPPAACTMLWWQGDSKSRAADKWRNDAGDAFRAFVMKDMGGLYLDLDIECFQHREHMIHGLDLVLQVNLDDTLKTGQVPVSLPICSFLRFACCDVQTYTGLICTICKSGSVLSSPSISPWAGRSGKVINKMKPSDRDWGAQITHVFAGRPALTVV